MSELHVLVTAGSALEKPETDGSSLRQTSLTYNEYAHYYARDLYLLLSIITKMLPPPLHHYFYFFTRTFPHDRLRGELFQDGSTTNPESIPLGCQILDSTTPEYPLLFNGLAKLQPELQDDNFIRTQGPIYVRIPTTGYQGNDDDPIPQIRFDSRDSTFWKLYHLLRILYNEFIEEEGTTIRQLIDRGISECRRILSPLQEDGGFFKDPKPKLKLPEGLESEQYYAFNEFVMEQVDYYFVREQMEVVLPAGREGRGESQTNTLPFQRKRRTCFNRDHGVASRVGGASLRGKRFNVEAMQRGLNAGPNEPTHPTLGNLR